MGSIVRVPKGSAPNLDDVVADMFVALTKILSWREPDLLTSLTRAKTGPESAAGLQSLHQAVLRVKEGVNPTTRPTVAKGLRKLDTLLTKLLPSSLNTKPAGGVADKNVVTGCQEAEAIGDLHSSVAGLYARYGSLRQRYSSKGLEAVTEAMNSSAVRSRGEADEAAVRDKAERCGRVLGAYVEGKGRSPWALTLLADGLDEYLNSILKGWRAS